jgi:hypothetical protein
VVLRRVELPIVGRCPVDVELRPDAHGRSWCEHCDEPVHALSGMREHEVRALVAAHAGRSLCVEYRVRADGTIALRSEPARAWLAPALAGLAACGPVDSTTTPDDGIVVPAAGCPLHPTPSLETTMRSGEQVVRIDFHIDEGPQVFRGMVVGIDSHHRADRSDRLEWIPTKKLWKDFVARVRARHARAAR